MLSSRTAASCRNLWARGALGHLGSLSRLDGGSGCSKGFSTLTVETLPKTVLECEYAVRGAVLKRAEELEKVLHQGGDAAKKLPFTDVVPCNIGNPQVLGQEPATFHRQVMAAIAEPSLIQSDIFPEDVRERAARYIAGVQDGRMGAYSHSKGHSVFRQEIADFITERDGLETDLEDIYLTDGASLAAKLILSLAIRGPQDGILLPIPQYPLYTATMSLLGGKAQGYFLDEEAGWGVSVEELERSITEMRAAGNTPRALVVINPGNPCGQVLSRAVLEDVLHFAEREQLMVIADEVYQDNIHVDTKEFVSMRKVAHDLGVKVEIFSLHSASKGVIGECGLRGGYVHCENVRPDVMDQIYKMASVNLCANVLGQGLMASLCRPPPLGSPSQPLYAKQTGAVRESLKRKAIIATERLNAIEGIECQPIEGAMYAFPRITIKGYVMKKAISLATPADQIYCLEMVERTGVITVPGSGFGQKPGQFHLRITILPEEQQFLRVLDRFEKFHNEHPHGWFD